MGWGGAVCNKKEGKKKHIHVELDIRLTSGEAPSSPVGSCPYHRVTRAPTDTDTAGSRPPATRGCPRAGLSRALLGWVLLRRPPATRPWYSTLGVCVCVCVYL